MAVCLIIETIYERGSPKIWRHVQLLKKRKTKTKLANYLFHIKYVYFIFMKHFGVPYIYMILY